MHNANRALDLTVTVKSSHCTVEFQLGFPSDFLAECEPVFGDIVTAVDPRRPG